MKKLACVSLTVLSLSVFGKDIHCTSQSKALVLKSFTIKNFFSNEAHSSDLNGYLLGGREFKENTVEYLITNECDHDFQFSFPLQTWRNLAAGKRKTISATVEYEYPGRIGEDEVQKGTATVYCKVISQ